MTMEEDLSRMWGNLSLTEAEDEEMEIGGGVMEGMMQRSTSCLVGKWISDRFISKEVVKSFLIRGLKPEGRVTFKVVGDNVFLMEFEHEWEKAKVLEWRPWVFDGNLFSVAEFDGVTQLVSIEFEKVALWVRMLNLPLACMNSEIGTMIGSAIGQVEEIEIDEEGVGWGRFLHAKIQMDLTKPLICGRRLKVQGVSMWVDLQYERLPRFCFSCGVVKHGALGCMKKVQDGGSEYGA
jgi:hypothetical protein